MDIKPFVNNSRFYAPIWTDHYGNFVATLMADSRYRAVDKQEQMPQYMLPYINRIYREDDLFFEFELKEEFLPRLSLYRCKVREGASPILKAIRLCCFSTGCVLAEFLVEYHGMSVDEIADYAALLKNAKRSDKEDADFVNIEAALRSIMPESAEATVFFTAGPSDFKIDCKMFHQIRLDGPIEEAEMKRHLVHLRRGYDREFDVPLCEGEYDVIYSPYDYDRWAGSQEGLVNVFFLSGRQRTDGFLTKYKPDHLSRNYRFLYLLLLNQRFSAISYLDKISQMNHYTRVEKEKLNDKISLLKTTFTFNVVSDDLLYQNLYAKMYAILDIDRLLTDIHDNEEQIEVLQNHEMLENEKKTSVILFALSLLSVFSVLVDAAGYFDRISFLQGGATQLSFGCLITIGACYLFWWLSYRRK